MAFLALIHKHISVNISESVQRESTLQVKTVNVLRTDEMEFALTLPKLLVTK